MVDKQPIRIAMFAETFLPEVNGIVTTMLVMLDHLKSVGAEVIIFTPEHDTPKSYKGFRIVSMPSKPSVWYADRYHSLPKSNEWQILQNFQPDIVHLWHPSVTSVIGVWFARRLNLPLLISYHINYAEAGQYYGYAGKAAFRTVWALSAFTFNAGDLTLAPSTFTANQMAEYHHKRVQVWTHGVDPDKFSPHFVSPAMRSRLTNNNPERPLCIYVGRIAAEKQVSHLKHIVERIPDVHLAIIGDGPELPKLKATFPSERTTFTGTLLGEDLAAAYASADVFIFPTSNFETFGITALEALMSGTPVVGSNVAGMLDLVTHGHNGFLFDVGDIDQMVAYTQQLVTDPNLLKTMTANAHPSVQNFTWDVPAHQLVEHYCALIKKHKQQGNWRRVMRALPTVGIAHFQWQNSTNPVVKRMLDVMVKREQKDRKQPSSRKLL